MDAEQLRKEMQKGLRERLTEQTNGFYEGIVNDPDVLGRIPESIFVNYFLPRFIGEIPIAYNDPVFRHWALVAGTPTNRVAVIDQAGNILFTVPPLVDTSRYDPSGSGNIGLTSLLNYYERLLDRNPNEANSFLVKTLYSTITASMSKGEADSNTWAGILRRYGKLPVNRDPFPENTYLGPEDDELIYE